MNTPEQSRLGHGTVYPDRYDAGLLFPIPRAPARVEIGVGAELPFQGVDIWNAYELSWLDVHGKPEVAIGEFRVPATSPHLIESKSLKLYLNGYNGERMGGVEAVRERIATDVSAAAGAKVEVRLTPAAAFAGLRIEALGGESIDGLAVSIDDYGPPNAEHLRAATGVGAVEEVLVSDLLKSNCPVTGQPDWASVQVRYAGARIDREGLLRYLVSYRDHAAFHEQCVERIFVDLLRRCAPTRLEVQARYTRRGGLDINPWRSTHAGGASNPRGARQ